MKLIIQWDFNVPPSDSIPTLESRIYNPKEPIIMGKETHYSQWVTESDGK